MKITLRNLLDNVGVSHSSRPFISLFWSWIDHCTVQLCARAKGCDIRSQDPDWLRRLLRTWDFGHSWYMCQLSTHSTSLFQDKVLSISCITISSKFDPWELKSIRERTSSIRLINLQLRHRHYKDMKRESILGVCSSIASKIVRIESHKKEFYDLFWSLYTRGSWSKQRSQNCWDKHVFLPQPLQSTYHRTKDSQHFLSPTFTFTLEGCAKYILNSEH